jgi:hypothetical protein
MIRCFLAGSAALQSEPCRGDSYTYCITFYQSITAMDKLAVTLTVLAVIVPVMTITEEAQMASFNLIPVHGHDVNA